jgi:hypothetical protein
MAHESNMLASLARTGNKKDVYSTYHITFSVFSSNMDRPPADMLAEIHQTLDLMYLT